MGAVTFDDLGPPSAPIDTSMGVSAAPKEKPSSIASAVRGAEEGATLNWWDRLAAMRGLSKIPGDGFAVGALNNMLAVPQTIVGGAATAASKLAPTVFGTKYSDDYDKNFANERGYTENAEKANPKSYTAGELGGGLLSGMFMPEVGAANMVSKIPLAAKIASIAPKTANVASKGADLAAMGGVYGSIAGAGAANDVGSMPDGAAHGAELGAVLTPTLGPAIGALARGSVAGARKIGDLVSPLPKTPMNTADVAGVKIPLSTGQATGDMDISMSEQNALRNGLGPQAQRVAQGFKDQQNAALDQAHQNISAGLNPAGGTIAGNPQDAANIISQGVKAASQNAKDTYNYAYQRFAALPGEFDPGTFNKVGESIRQRLWQGNDPIAIDNVVTPHAATAIRDIDSNVGTNIFQNLAQPKGPNGQDPGVTLQKIDEARKRLVKFYSQAKKNPANQADIEATHRVIGAFDDHVQDAIDAGLFSGDQNALPTLKAARAAYSDYRKTFTPQGAGDDVGRIMQKIIGKDADSAATPTEVSNWLFGANGTGQTGTAVRVARRLKMVFRPDSPEWTAVRQGMFSKLTEPTEGTTGWGAQKLTNRMAEFLDGAGAPLSKVLFSPEELSIMKHFANINKQILPPDAAVNRSNTSATLAKVMAGHAHKVLPAIGALFEASHGGGMMGGLAGAAAGYGADRAATSLLNRNNAVNTAKSFYGSAAQAPVPIKPALAPLLSTTANQIKPQVTITDASQNQNQPKATSQFQLIQHDKTGQKFLWNPQTGDMHPYYQSVR